MIGRWYDPEANIHIYVLGIDDVEGRAFYRYDDGEYQDEYVEVPLIHLQEAISLGILEREVQ